ncbi:MAG: hypothetical protein RL559_380 [Pseudomonadota bacterium]|jgi:aminoglycoside phosphotransferase family enzyme/predicted kinase
MAPDALPPLIRALLEPQLYPGAVPRVELLQTHGAWVLLAGEAAYKIKKPVRLSFMDFSTLALRRAACEAELRVNARCAPTPPQPPIYRAVLPIVGTPESPRWGQPGVDEGEAIEFAVQMHRFGEAARLDHLCLRGALQPEQLAQLGQRLATWQAQAAVAPAEAPWGQPDTVWVVVHDNLQALEALLEPGDDPVLVQSLSDWTRAQWPTVSAALAERRRSGHVREGHGDLHLANLVLLAGEVLPFDAIEFNEALRWVDVASDLAFTWMDLQRLGQPGLAHTLLSAWMDASGDVGAPAVLPFFGVYLALVRAKVAAIARTQRSATDERAALQAELCVYLQLAQRLAQPGAPQLIITHGLSGSGKSFEAGRWLAAQGGSRALRLRSDVERKRLHGLAALQASAPSERERFYGPEASALTYASLRGRARDLLQAGWTVLVDAAFLRRAEREAFAALARELGCPFAVLAPEAPLAVLRERIAARQAAGTDPSEATLAVLEQQLGWIEPLGADEPRLPWPPAP